MMNFIEASRRFSSIETRHRSMIYFIDLTVSSMVNRPK